MRGAGAGVGGKFFSHFGRNTSGEGWGKKRLRKY